MNEKEDKMIRDTICNLEMLKAVEILEYHNKNWLAFDNSQRSRRKQELIKCTLELLNISLRDGG